MENRYSFICQNELKNDENKEGGYQANFGNY